MNWVAARDEDALIFIAVPPAVIQYPLQWVAAQRARATAAVNMVLSARLLETEFQSDIGLSLLGVVADGRHEASQRLIAKRCAGARRARRRPTHFGAQRQVRSE